MKEWDFAGPASHGDLRGLFFDDPETRRQIDHLNRAGVLEVSELRDGLSVRSNSFIGHLTLGPLEIVIEPKIAWERWLALVAFGLDLRTLTRLSRVDAGVTRHALQDLLILALQSELRDLIARGLHKDYEILRRRTPRLRGRIDFPRLVASGGMSESALPMRFHRRSLDNVLNRALLAGLSYAAVIASDRSLASNIRRDAAALDGVTRVDLSRQLLDSALDSLDRRTLRYRPALSLIELLRAGLGQSTEESSAPPIMGHGFLLDMNRIWQRVLSRVLSEWSEFDVREEWSLREFFIRDETYPYRESVPRPRPDFAVFEHGQLNCYLDAKYRDLWTKPLPREMLYQLSIYALSYRKGIASILYPSHGDDAREQRIHVSDPFGGAARATVALRPVNLDQLWRLILSGRGRGSVGARASFANGLIVGRGGST